MAGGFGQPLETPQLKKPIFIGCADSEIITKIERYLFENQSFGMQLSKEEYEYLIIHPSVYHSLNQQYLYTQLSEEEQKRQNEAKMSEELKQHALMLALQIEHRIRVYRNSINKKVTAYYEQHPEELFQFNEGELKSILNGTMPEQGGWKRKYKNKVVAKHEDTWSVIDLLLIQGHLEVVDLDTTHIPKEKVQYRLIISAKDRLQLLQAQLEVRRIAIKQAITDRKHLKDRIEQLEHQINTAQNEKITEPSIEANQDSSITMAGMESTEQGDSLEAFSD